MSVFPRVNIFTVSNSELKLAYFQFGNGQVCFWSGSGDFGRRSRCAGAGHDLGRMAGEELEAVQLATLDALTQRSNRRGFDALSPACAQCLQADGQARVAAVFRPERFQGDQ
jgi:hypothetical protein